MLKIVFAVLFANIVSLPVSFLPDIIYLFTKKGRKTGCLTKKPHILFPALTALELAIFISSQIIVKNHTLCEEFIFGSFWVVFICALVLSVSFSLGIFYSEAFKAVSKNAVRFFKNCFVACLAILCAELFVFNFVSYNSHPQKTVLPLDALTAEAKNVQSDAISVENTDYISFSGKGGNIGAVRLEFEGEDDYFRIGVSIKDDNNKGNLVSAASSVAVCERGYVEMSIKPYGSLYEMQLKFSEIESDVRITAVSLLSAKTFCFNSLRFFALLLICCIILAVVDFDLMRIKFNPKSLAHNIAVWMLVPIFISFIPHFASSEEEPVEYPLWDVGSCDAFAQMFDSFEKDIPYLDIKVDERLNELENVYDVSQRDGLNYVFDRAFYEGKYYSYFGVAPTLTFWRPYYAIKGVLPTQNTAHLFAAFVSTIALFGAAIEFVKRYCKNVSVVALILALFSLEFTSGVALSLFFGDGYFIPIAFGLMYLFLAIWSGFGASNCENHAFRTVLLVLSGVFFVLCVASRPTIAFGAILLIPMFISLLCDGKYSKKVKAISACAFALPVIIGGIMIMNYNFVRFGSPFDFGMKYQLTVCDVSQKSLDITNLPAALYHYFFATPNITADFPYIMPRVISFLNYGQYTYIEFGFGVLSFASVALGIVFAPLVLKRKNCSKEKRAVIVTAIVSAIFVAFVDFCFGGYNIRYIMDILPMLSLMSTIVLLEVHSACNDNATLKAPCSFALAVSFLQPAAMLALYAMYIPTVVFIKENPEIYCILKDLIVFWR